MSSVNRLAQGFLCAVGLIWSLSITALFIGGDTWAASLYLLILLVPVSSLIYVKVRETDQQKAASDLPTKWRNLLFSFQGVGLAFWMFDIATTFYAINVTGLAAELNPLGWPLGILGAFAYYAPSILFSYFLLFKKKESVCLYAAIPLAMLTLLMGTMNLLAGTQNFQVFVSTAMLSVSIRYGLFAAVSTVLLAVWVSLKRPFNPIICK